MLLYPDARAHCRCLGWEAPRGQRQRLTAALSGESPPLAWCAVERAGGVGRARKRAQLAVRGAVLRDHGRRP